MEFGCCSACQTAAAATVFITRCHQLVLLGWVLLPLPHLCIAAAVAAPSHALFLLAIAVCLLHGMNQSIGSCRPANQESYSTIFLSSPPDSRNIISFTPFPVLQLAFFFLLFLSLPWLWLLLLLHLHLSNATSNHHLLLFSASFEFRCVVSLDSVFLI